MPTVVLEHILDEDEGVYRITFAEQTETTSTENVPLTDKDGNPVLDEDGNQKMESVERTQTFMEPAETIVFSADDERWFRQGGERRALSTVAEEQREIVKNALAQRKRNATRAANEAEEQSAGAVTEMPGVGEAL